MKIRIGTPINPLRPLRLCVKKKYYFTFLSLEKSKIAPQRNAKKILPPRPLPSIVKKNNLTNR
jgi:hypothetical protein